MTGLFADWNLLDQRLVRIALVIALLFIVQFLARKFVGRIVEKVIHGHKFLSKREERQRADTLINMFRAALIVVLWIIAIIIVLQELGVNFAALVTGAGVIGIVVGLGARGIISDLLSGIFIILENQYRIGDIVTIAGYSGVVQNITIRMTKLRDLEGNVYFIPNGTITSVTNKTLGFSNVVIDIGVSYSTDISKAEKVINEVGEEMAKDPEWEDLVTEPIQFLRLDSFGETNILLKAFGKVTPADQWKVAGEFRKRIKKAFDKNKIDLTAPPVPVVEPPKK